MPKIPATAGVYPQKFAQSLLARNAYLLMGKMSRELGRFEKAEGDTLKWSSDHGINFCTTAWHMIDWLWSEARAESWPQEALVRVFGRPVHSQEQLREAAVSQCPELRVCRLIATAAKHFAVDRFADPSMQTRLVLREHRRRQIRAYWIIEWDAGDGIASYEAVEIFRTAHWYWRRQLMELGILEDSVLGDP